MSRRVERPRSLIPGGSILLGSASAGLLCLMLASAPSGCASVENTRGIPPLFEIYEGTGGKREYVLRPLGGWTTGPEERALRLIWPLFNWHRTPPRTRSWLLPVFFYNRRLKDDGNDTDWLLFPIIFAGKSPKDGGYFALFPIGGTFRGMLGQDHMMFVLFPLYLRARDRERVSHHVLWPVVNWLGGGNRSGWRVWPLWGEYRGWTPEGKPKYRRRFFLWPFFHLQENNLDTRNPTTFFAFFPFYGRITSERFVKTTHLWPLFQSSEHLARDTRILSSVFFPVVFARGPGIEQTDVWPFYGQKRTETLERHFVLWPIERYEKGEDKDHRSRRFWLLPFYWRFHDEDLRTGRVDDEWKLWPFFRYTRGPEGSDLHTLSLLWFKDPEGFERYYARLWRLFRYRTQAGGEWAWELLWGTIFSAGDDAGRSRRFSILGGLFGYSREGSERRYRILYIPF